MIDELIPSLEDWYDENEIDELDEIWFEKTRYKPPKKYKLKDLGLVLKHQTAKAFLFEINSENLPSKYQEILIWIPAYCIKNFKYINEDYVYKLVFKIKKHSKVTHNVLNNPEQYKGKTAKQIYNIVSRDIPNIVDLGFSKTQIYYTVQKTEVIEMSFLNYINKYFKGNK